jgi:dihydrofolate synthase / folylpolyglutamate synthase
MNYQQAWDYLDSLQFHKIKLGLDAMRSFMARVHNPEQQLKTVHVAGTNGKGSVSITLLTILSEAGYRVGMYTSPHLSSVRERFRIGNTFVSEETFARLATQVRDILGDEKITYFEFTTAIAFLWFAEEKLDLVVLETGLGGRLDATNIVTPLVSVITNISMDHEAYLGDTIAAVAAEKAGIVKESVPVVTAVKESAGLTEVQATCKEKNTSLYQYEEDFFATVTADNSWQWSATDALSSTIYTELRCSMKGDYQIENASLALATIQLLQDHGLQISDKTVRKGLASVHWPGRLESFSLDRAGKEIHYLLDGAHNPAGVESLVQTLKKECRYNKLIVIWGAMADKDLQTTLATVAELAQSIVLTKPNGERSADPELLLKNIPEIYTDKCTLLPTVESAISWAENLASPEDLILIAGSLYLVGASRQILLGELVP